MAGKLGRIACAAGLAAIGLGAIWAIQNRRLFIVSDVTTGENSYYPEIRAHVYFGPPPDVAKAVEQSIQSLPNWRFVGDVDAGLQLYAEVENPVTGILSDVFVTISSLGESHTRVVIRSRSRLNCAAGDLGDNARNILQLQAAMDGIFTGG